MLLAAQGTDCFGAFMQSGLPKASLKQIWDLVAGDEPRLKWVPCCAVPCRAVPCCAALSSRHQARLGTMLQKAPPSCATGRARPHGPAALAAVLQPPLPPLLLPPQAAHPAPPRPALLCAAATSLCRRCT